MVLISSGLRKYKSTTISWICFNEKGKNKNTLIGLRKVDSPTWSSIAHHVVAAHLRFNERKMVGPNLSFELQCMKETTRDHEKSKLFTSIYCSLN